MKDFLDEMAESMPGVTIHRGEEPSYITDMCGELMADAFHDLSGVERDEFLEWMHEKAAKPMGIDCQVSRVALRILNTPH